MSTRGGIITIGISASTTPFISSHTGLTTQDFTGLPSLDITGTGQDSTTHRTTFLIVAPTGHGRQSVGPLPVEKHEGVRSIEELIGAAPPPVVPPEKPTGGVSAGPRTGRAARFASGAAPTGDSAPPQTAALALVSEDAQWTATNPASDGGRDRPAVVLRERVSAGAAGAVLSAGLASVNLANGAVGERSVMMEAKSVATGERNRTTNGQNVALLTPRRKDGLLETGRAVRFTLGAAPTGDSAPPQTAVLARVSEDAQWTATSPVSDDGRHSLAAASWEKMSVDGTEAAPSASWGSAGPGKKTGGSAEIMSRSETLVEPTPPAGAP
ncbi:hypothetical protein [Salinibacter sp.]|uniref:hypothetical protein n=1 Tax=Salinibacter sp. TaxID=2065818 RepID=UPI0035D4991E